MPLLKNKEWKIIGIISNWNFNTKATGTKAKLIATINIKERMLKYNLLLFDFGYVSKIVGSPNVKKAAPSSIVFL